MKKFFSRLLDKILYREVDETRKLLVFRVLYGPVEEDGVFVLGVKLRDGDMYRCTEFRFQSFDTAYSFLTSIAYSKDGLEVSIDADAEIE